MSNENPVPSNESVFAEAFAAATEGMETDSSEAVEAAEIQDIPSGQDVEETTEETTAPEDQDQSLSEDAETPEGLSESIQEIQVKDKDGKRKNIKVDFSDREKLTKYVQKAANAVRLQSERDALQAQVAKLNETQEALTNLQEIVDTKGFEGLIDKLNAENGGFKAWMDSKFSKHEQRLHASEDELAKLDAEEKASELQRRLDRIEAQQAEREERMAQENQKAELNKLASDVNPIYFKYTFDGKLGDSVAEQRYNKAMFRDVTETLDNLAEEGVKITPALIEREFRAYAQPLMKGVNRKVRQNTKKAIDRKKAEATTHAQQQVRNGSATDQTSNTGNWVKDLTADWLNGRLK